jgi:hypothetical protein
MSFDEKTNDLLNDIIAENAEFDLEDVVKILPRIIIHLDLYSQKGGLEQRESIINMFKHIVDNTDGPGDDALFDPIIKRLIPGMIDLLIEVDKGKIKLRNKKCLKFICK